MRFFSDVCFHRISKYQIEKQFLSMFKSNFILCLRRKNIDFMCRTLLFFFFVHHSSSCEQWHGIYTQCIHPLAWHCWIYDLFYFIWFDFQMELKCQLRLNRWERNCLGSMSTVQLQHISKCEMLFMFSSNVCMRCTLCGHFYSILRQ